MGTKAEPTLTEQGAHPTTHRVHIEYGEALEVKNYPPRNLKTGDIIVFEPVPSGELELTFEYGSNFRQLSNGATVGPGQTISGQNPSVKVIEPMKQPPELDDLKRKAETDGWFQTKIDDLTLNAWPFSCKLTIGYGDGDTPSETYEGGFPRPPRK